MARAETPPGRAVRFFRVDEPIRCAVGHRIPREVGLVEHGWVRCMKPAPTESGKRVVCNEYLYVRHFRDGWVGVARIDWREAFHLQKLQMTVDEAAAYLHITWHRGAA